MEFSKKIKYEIEKFQNKIIIKRYPFLQIRNVWTDKIIECDYTLLDNLPDGWKKLALNCAREIKAAFKTINYRGYDKYRIFQLKEKWGGMRWYDYGVPYDLDDDISNILNKYELKSTHTCWICGREAKWASKGYILPYCDKCAGYPTNNYEFSPLINGDINE